MGTSIVVTDGEQRSALAAVRSLGRAGYAVHVCSSVRAPLAGASKYVSSTTRVADPLRAPEQFARDVGRVVSSNAARVLIPVTDASILAVLSFDSLFGDAALPFPRGDAFVKLSDKSAVLQRAGELGIATPRQVLVDKPLMGEPVDGAMDFPVVVKPARSVSLGNGERVKSVVAFASNPAELRERLAAVHELAYPVLVQQQIRGPGVGVFVLLWNGEVKAAFSHRRIREKPPRGGVCVLGESRTLDPELLRLSVELIRSFDWWGVAMIEYKLDAERGTPYLMEVNPRFWGSLQLAIDAGVDFPRLLVELLLGMDAGSVTAYRGGARMRWFWGDVDNLLARLRSRNGGGTGEERRVGAGRAVAEFLGAFRGGIREEVGRMSDPAPFIRESLNWIRGR